MATSEVPREVGVLPPERRARLLAAAAAEFVSAGYEGASLNRVIRACGMSKSSFYHYFRGKDALFDAVVAELATALAERLHVPDAAVLGRDFWDQVAGLVGRLAELARDEASFTDLARLFYLSDAPAGASPALARVRDEVEGWLARALAAGRASGAVRDDLPEPLQLRLALAVLEVMDEWAVEHLDDASAAEPHDLAPAQLDALRRLLAP